MTNYLVKKIFNDKNSIFVFLLIGLVFIFVFKDTTVGEQSFTFTIGILLSQFNKVKSYLENRNYKTTISFLVVGILFSGVFLILKSKGLDSTDHYILMNIVQLLMKLPLAFVLIQFTFMYKNYLYNGLIMIGVYSYEIYLTHTQILERIRYGSYYELLLFFLTIIFISLVIHRLSGILDKLLIKRISIIQ